MLKDSLLPPDRLQMQEEGEMSCETRRHQNIKVWVFCAFPCYMLREKACLEDTKDLLFDSYDGFQS